MAKIAGECHIPTMGTKRIKRPRDPIALAKLIGDIATGRVEDRADDTRNPAAVQLGRLGGKKGGKARAKKLTPEQRREMARHAAQQRWAAHKREED